MQAVCGLFEDRRLMKGLIFMRELRKMRAIAVEFSARKDVIIA